MQYSEDPRRPEQELLLACAAWPGKAGSGELFARLATEHVDWNYVLTAADSHVMLPRLHSCVERLQPSHVPSEVRAALHGARIANAAQGLRLTGELLALLQLLGDAGIEAVPFKGPALAAYLFGDVAMRQFRDLDILVKPGEVRRAKQALLARGYTPEFQLSAVREEEYIRSEHAFQLVRARENLVVELHWRFGSRHQAFPLGAPDVWRRLRRADIGGHTVNALCPEDLIVYLAMHGAKHRWERLEWIASLAEVIRREPDADWPGIVARARETGAWRGLSLGMLLAWQFCGTSTPSPVRGELEPDRAVRGLAQQVREGLFAADATHEAREIGRHLFYLRCRERRADRARIVLFSCARIPHPLARDWDLFRLPASLQFLYYLLRPLRLFREHGLRLLQRQDSI